MTAEFDSFKEVKVEQRDGVLMVTLNRPENGNPTTWTMIGEINTIWKSLPENTEIRAVVLAGAGEDFSCLRGSVAIHPPLKQPHPLQNLELAGAAIHGGGAYHMSSMKYILDVPQPIIAAIQGRCTGLATTLALCCDIVIAAENAQISDPHIVRGMVPGDGGIVLWPLLVGVARAKEYLLTGDSLSGLEAARIGLVNRAVPADRLADTAYELAKRIAAGSPLAIRFTKHVMNKIIQHQMELVWELADAYQVFSTQAEDAREARQAAAEKRPPHYTGR
jgi:enoyl-CoA hydratase